MNLRRLFELEFNNTLNAFTLEMLADNGNPIWQFAFFSEKDQDLIN